MFQSCIEEYWAGDITLLYPAANHGTDGLINNWNTMVSKCGQRNIYPNIGNLQITLLYLMTIVG